MAQRFDADSARHGTRARVDQPRSDDDKGGPGARDYHRRWSGRNGDRRGVLVGAWAVAPMAGEWIHQAAMVLREEIPIERLLGTVAQFPTYAGAYLEALERLEL